VIECDIIMALDQQRNWTISMAESLQATKDKTAAAKPHEQPTTPFPTRDDDPKLSAEELVTRQYAPSTFRIAACSHGRLHLSILCIYSPYIPSSI